MNLRRKYTPLRLKRAGGTQRPGIPEVIALCHSDMSKLFHVSLGVSGALRRPQDFVGYITYNGKLLTTKREVKEFLEYQLAMGRKLLPMADCPDHDYITGCPGHDTSEP